MTQISRRALVAGLVGVAATAAAPGLARAGSADPQIALPGDVARRDAATITRIATGRPVVAMTFDDGPHPRLTPVLLDLLRARGIRATFFVIGQNVRRYPALMARMVAEGHEVGNHTLTHRALTGLDDEAVLREMDQTTLAVYQATGKAPVTMRPPYGAISARQRSLLWEQRRLPTILWSVDPQDWRKPGSDVVAQRILGHAHRGAVILAHDIHRTTVEAMPATLDGLVALGYQFQTMSEIMGWPRWQSRRFQLNVS